MGIHSEKERVTLKMPAETVFMEKVTRLYLTKHHLLHKAKKTNLARVVNDVCGLHAQAAQTPYLSLFNRIGNFDNGLLDKALYVDRALIKVWCMRGTLHVILSQDLPIYNRALRRMWFEHHGRFMHAPDWPPIEERKKRIYPAILKALAQKPVKRNDLNNKVRLQLKDDSKPYRRLFSSWGGILKETAYEGLTIHAEPCEREACFARLDQWLPNLNLERVSEEEAQTRLLIKYLRGYGPASQQDFCLWSGLMAGDAKNAIENASSMLERVEIKSAKGQLLILKEDLEALDSLSLDENAPLRLLPKFDSYLLGHKDRSRIIAEEHKKRVFRKAGDIAATLLINGRIAGTWKHRKTKTSLAVTLMPFRKLTREELEETEKEVEGLSRFMGVAEFKLQLAS